MLETYMVSSANWMLYVQLFDFVAETGLSRPHEKRSRKTIRAHASRHSRQRKGKENDATKNWANHMAEL